MHVHSNTGRHVRSGDDIRFTTMAIDLFRAHLPAGMAHRVTRRAKQTYALSALGTARAMIGTGDGAAAWAQIGAALESSRSLPVLGRAARVVAGAAVAPFKRLLRRSSGSPGHGAVK